MHKYVIFLTLILLLLISIRAEASIEEFLSGIAREYYQRGEYSQALHEYKKVLILDPDNQEAKEAIRELEAAGVSAKEAITDAPKSFKKEEPTRKISSRDLAIEQALRKVEGEREKDREKSLVSRLNTEKEKPKEKVEFIKLSGEARMALGFTKDDIIWNDANGDKIGVPLEKNWRYLWGQQRYNTYDAKIYDRLRLDFSSVSEGPLSVFMQVNIDPWTFIGKNRVVVTATSGGDAVEMDLKYWSGSKRTINEIYRSNFGNIINLSEIKVNDGDIGVGTPKGISDWYTTFNSIGPMELDRMYRPIRKLWFDYTEDNYQLHFFPISNQEEALTSDDPLRLSNNHVWWEESPWLDEYEPSRIFYPSGNPANLKKGRWIRRLSFFAKDSEQERLTFLRGLSLKSEFWNGTSLEATVATPMSLWDEYTRLNSIHNAVRLKKDLNENIGLGLTYTGKLGFHGGSNEAMNNVIGVDSNFQISPEFNIFAEVAASDTKIEEAWGFTTDYDGIATQIGFSFDKTKFTLTHMEDDFFPGLANYRYTRSDMFYSQHISFTERNPENEAIRLGDGIDRGRNVIALYNESTFLNDKLETLFNYRNVHDDSGKYIESVFRTEATYKVNPKLTTKFLAWYKDLPRTKAGFDPLIYAKTSYSITDFFSEEDVFVENADVGNDKDPSIGAFGLGYHYDINDRLAWEGIYERTNDPLDFPRGLLVDTYQTTEVIDGVRYDKVVPFLYDQDMFDLPPYEYYGILKTKFIFKPVEPWTFILRYTKNNNKYSAGLDDNINHAGLEVSYKPNNKFSCWFKYIYSKFKDVYRQNKDNIIVYDGHHNVFLGFDYNIDENQALSVLWGEFVGYNDPYADGQWSLSALDTQHILRLFYKRDF